MLSSRIWNTQSCLSRGLLISSKKYSSTTVSKQFQCMHPLRAKGRTFDRTIASNQRRTLTSNTKNSNNAVTGTESIAKKTFLQRWMGHKEIAPRGTLKWYGEMTLICTVFAITGTSTMVLVRPAVSNVLGLRGSLKDGPWSYRICSLVIMTPLYSAMLVVVGVSA